MLSCGPARHNEQLGRRFRWQREREGGGSGNSWLSARLNATYWPRPSCQRKKCTCVNNRYIRSKVSGDNLDCRRVELSANMTLARSRCTSNYYITRCDKKSDQLERRCCNENHVPAEAGPPGPRLSSPGERERNATVARKVRESICCSSVQFPTHLSQIIPFVIISNPFE